MKTQDYLDVFARFKGKQTVEAVERVLATHQELEYFERSQLGMYLYSRIYPWLLDDSAPYACSVSHAK